MGAAEDAPATKDAVANGIGIPTSPAGGGGSAADEDGEKGEAICANAPPREVDTAGDGVGDSVKGSSGETKEDVVPKDDDHTDGNKLGTTPTNGDEPAVETIEASAPTNQDKADASEQVVGDDVVVGEKRCQSNEDEATSKRATQPHHPSSKTTMQ